MKKSINKFSESKLNSQDKIKGGNSASTLGETFVTQVTPTDDDRGTTTTTATNSPRSNDIGADTDSDM